LSPLTLAQIQLTITTGYNAAAVANGSLIADTGAGSSFGPAFNAVAFAIFQQQNQILYVAAISRLATIPANQNGTPNPDVDSFVAPWGFTRLGASASSGLATFSTPSNVLVQIVVPVGAIVQTPGGLQFAVIADPNNTAYNAGLNGYPIIVSTSSVNATVQCLTTGTIGNVQAGQITQLFGGVGATQIPAPVNAVTNTLAFTNGINFESDAALKARFTSGQSTGRNAGTGFAVRAAALGVQPGLIVSYGDRINVDGSPHSAWFTLVVAVAGSSTTTPSSIINNVIAALEGNPLAIPPIPPARPAGIAYNVVSPTTFTGVNVSALLTLISGAVPATVVALAQASVTAYISGIGLDPYGKPTTVSYTKVAAILWSISGIANVDNILLNSGTSDVTAPFAQMLIPGTMTFTTA
jgi:hypothetical protein